MAKKKNPRSLSGAGMIGGAAAGAATGALLGPVSAAIGAVAGGIAGANAPKIARSKTVKTLRSKVGAATKKVAKASKTVTAKRTPKKKPARKKR